MPQIRNSQRLSEQGERKPHEQLVRLISGCE